jgi:hypothetical protein
VGIRTRSAHRLDWALALAPAMRRVDGVRITVWSDETCAEVFGLGYRHPVTLSIGMRLAHRLVEAGAPLELCLRDPARSPRGAVSA